MNDFIKQTIDALDSWMSFLTAHLSDKKQPMNRVWGWNAPSLTREDVSLRVEKIKALLSELPDDLNGSLKVEIEESPERLNWILHNVLPNLPGGNAPAGVQIMYQEFDRLERALAHDKVDWEKLLSDGLLPRKLTSRLRAVEARLSDLEPRSGDLHAKIKLIEDATASAEQLPTDLETLAEGRKQVTSTLRAVEIAAAKVEETSASASDHLNEVKSAAEDAEKLYERLEQIYKAGATKGLASAFSKKASDLNYSLYLWTFLLILTLAVGGWIGALRFETLQKILSQPVTPTAFWANFLFSLISIAAPIWLGWVATKQINQRFKLAEDYSFKASVATAYEGYRSEAVRLDPEFEKRLFGSALSRLEEAPLRFVDTENFGTPWHELTSSPAFAKALEAIPDLKGTVAAIVAGAGGAATGAASVLKGLGKNDDGASRAKAPRPSEEDTAE